MTYLVLLTKMKQFISLLFVLSCFTLTTTAQSITTYPYAQRDTGYLQLDFYTPESPKEGNPLIVYIFGGGFSVGERNSNQNMNNCKLYQQEGYYVAAIDYRLGIKGINKFTPQTVENAIKYGVEDCVDAINFLYNNAEKLNINTSQIYLLGSSAGAIISLQTDYFRANNHEITAHLPNNFTFAGIISYSGAIYRHHGKP